MAEIEQRLTPSRHRVPRRSAMQQAHAMSAEKRYLASLDITNPASIDAAAAKLIKGHPDLMHQRTLYNIIQRRADQMLRVRTCIAMRERGISILSSSRI